MHGFFNPASVFLGLVVLILGLQSPEPRDLYGMHITHSDGVIAEWIAQDPHNRARPAKVVSRIHPGEQPDVTIEWTSGKKEITLNFWKRAAETEEQFLSRIEARVNGMKRIYPES